MRRPLRRCKKGSLPDLILIGAGLLMFAFVVLIMFKVVGSFDNKLRSAGIVEQIPNTALNSTRELQNHFTGVVDNSFLFLSIGLALVSIALAALVKVHPVFIPFYIIALVFVIVLGGVFSNIYTGVAASSQLSAEAGQLTFINAILPKLPLILGVFGIILMIIMYKTRDWA